MGRVRQFPDRRRGTVSGPLMPVADERVDIDAWSFSYARVHAAGRVVRRERCRSDLVSSVALLRVFGPDHPITLSAAVALTVALVRLGEATPARALGEDTLQRCRRAFGAEHPITLYLTQAGNIT